MSSGLVLVRFPDGDVKVGCYQGSVDICHDLLIDDPHRYREAGHKPAHRRENPEPGETRYYTDPPVGEVFDVDIWCGYGSGEFWRGRATRGEIVDGRVPYGLEDGKGGWDTEPRETTRGNPDWVVAYLRNNAMTAWL